MILKIGYSGGHKTNPTYSEVENLVFLFFFRFLNSSIIYNQVCSETTGHAEVVQVEYNPSIINTEKLLEIFFFLHDPTQLNRQGMKQMH